MHRRIYLFLSLIFILNISLTAQDINSEITTNSSDTTKNMSVISRSDALNIFIDCTSCDRTFFRETMTFVNYVNDLGDADVYIFMSRRSTGSGGSEHIIALSGQGRYGGMTDTLTYFSTPNQSGDETRRAHARIISMGLMRYVALTPLSNNISISYAESQGRGTGRGAGRGVGPSDGTSRVVVDDPWNSWVFRVSSNGNLSKDENFERSNLSAEFKADRVTPEWKSEFEASYNYRQTSFTRDDGEVLKFPTKSWEISSLQVKSLSPRLSAGANFQTSSSTVGNTRYTLQVHPALEYSIFPYSESFKRQIRIRYTVQFNYVDYMDTTLYLKLDEMIYRQQLSFAVGYNQPWGTANFSIRGSHLLNHPDMWSFRMNGRISYRVYRGLSLNFNANAAIIRDDRALLKGKVSLEDALMQIRRLNSKYTYSLGFGLSYSFGSIYNNVVNPRF